MCTPDLRCFLFQLAGEEGAETAEELAKQFEAHDILQMRDLKGLQLHDCDGSSGGTHSIWWEWEVMHVLSAFSSSQLALHY